MRAVSTETAALDYFYFLELGILAALETKNESVMASLKLLSSTVDKGDI